MKHFKGKRILIVDSDANLRLLYHSEFSMDGFEVYEAKNGREAIRLMRDTKPHLVIFDSSLGGFERLNALWGMSSINSGIPMILNSTDMRPRHRYLHWMADATVMKSSNLEPLKREVRALLFAFFGETGEEITLEPNAEKRVER